MTTTIKREITNTCTIKTLKQVWKREKLFLHWTPITDRMLRSLVC